MDHQARARMQQLIQSSQKVRAADFSSILNQFVPDIKVLSLDCFDTLIWRRAASPTDVFYDLHQSEIFRSLGLNANSRINAEGKARALMAVKNNHHEVTLKDIYRAWLPDATVDQVNQLIETELKYELNHCYGFPPVFDLIRAAKCAGLKIIIVSDTYFEPDQLKRLLDQHVPADVIQSIDRIFCSSAYQCGKPAGLFSQVIKAMQCKPEEILHIGDNPIADYAAPTLMNMKALQFMNQEEYISDLLRLQETTIKMIDPSVRSTQSLSYPFRGVFASQNLPLKPETLIGYAALGPIMYAFARFICDEIKKYQAENKELKVVFLMRDGHLPALSCEALMGHEVGKRVRISRFASYAASFCTPEDVDSYLIEVGKSNRFHDIARQLLLSEKVAEPLIKTALKSDKPEEEFIKQVRQKNIVSIILNQSAKYRRRLMAHLIKEVGLKKGDTLMLVDLGYSGTAQRRLTPAFKQLGVEVIGRYLISLRVPGWDVNRRGLLDPSWCDDKAMQTIVFYIMLLEQLSTSNERSVVDYDEEGNAIYSDVSMNAQQQTKLDHIQSECVRFIRDASQFFANAKMTVTDEVLRHTAMAELARLIFMPTQVELDYLQTFEAEMNLGTIDILRVFDPVQGLIGMRRRGMFYMERPSKMTRTNYPAELRSVGMELLLSLIAQHRFGLDLKLKDMAVRKEILEIVFQQNSETFATQIEAMATYDGFYAVWLPANIQINMNVGKKYDWIQVESIELITMDAFVNQSETQNTTNAWQYVACEQMKMHAGNLFEMLSDKSALIFYPPVHLKNDHVFRVVFRPITNKALGNETIKNNQDNASVSTNTTETTSQI